jgi:Kef-type K+ transport system membrane component KefB
MTSALAFTLLYVMAFLGIGLLSSRLMKLIHFPNVTGYLVSGILFGPFVLGAIVDRSLQTSDYLGLHVLFGSPLPGSSPAVPTLNVSWLSAVALCFIAFTIGQSFDKRALRQTGKRILITAFTEALGGSLAVFLGLLIAHFVAPESFPWPIILTLSAIASATAPAATVLVIRQYHAHGKVVDTLLPVVALDDAVALILFALFFSLAKALSGGTVNLYSLLLVPLMDIVLSLLLGFGLGWLLVYGNRYFKSRNNRLVGIVAVLLGIAGLSALHLFPDSSPLYEFQISPLLAAMMVGAVYCNEEKQAAAVIERIDFFTPPLFMLFFLISGAQLDVSIYYRDLTLLGMFLPLAVLYFFLRSIGKWVGAYLGSFSEKDCDPMIRKYLGFMLLPQAGVAIGLATTSGQQLTAPFALGYSYGDIVVCAILSTTILYNIIGAFLTKEALIRAGQVDGMGPLRETQKAGNDSRGG